MAGSVGSISSIAAFVAGLDIRLTYQEMKAISLAFSEAAGQLLNLAVFFLFAVLVVGQFRHFSPAFALYAVASLTLIRMVPVAISMIGTSLNLVNVLFKGWFGPRGLASFVLGLVYLKQHAGLPGESLIPTTGFLTVLVSIYAHGFSALPGIEGYAR